MEDSPPQEPVPRQNVRTAEFHAMFARLPKPTQELAEKTYQQFLRDPQHHSLRIHILRDTKTGKHRSGSISVSISKSYRAIFVVEGNVNVWYWIGSHGDYDKFVGR